MGHSAVVRELRLEDVLITDQLASRAARPPDYAGESAALCALVARSAESPKTVLQLLAEKVVELTGADSSGISIAEQDGDEPIFRWHANGGEFSPYVGATMPRYNSPCGAVLDRNTPLLMREPELYFPFTQPPPKPIYEVLLVPFYDGDCPVGTVWAMAHTRQKSFDDEDKRLMTSLSLFAASAVKNLQNLRLLEEKTCRLAKESQNKTEFLATLSHELRNPLAPIVIAAEILQRRSAETAVDAGLLDVISRQSKQLARIIDDLLDVSRVDTHKMELRKTIINLADVVRTAVETCQSYMDSRQHRFSVVLPEEEIYLNADGSRLAQVIVNLLNNACRYTLSGGEISLIATQNDDEAAIAVKDSGIGIQSEMAETIFDMFAQSCRQQGVAQSCRQEGGGLGIGLTLVKRIVEMHDGRVEVISQGEGCGSEFVVRLPKR